MKSLTRTFATALLVAGTIALSPAYAQQAYFGASVGSSDMDEDVAVGLITSGTVDGKDSGFKLVGGYRVNENFAFEIAYVDLGTARYAGDWFGSPVINGRLEIYGMNIAALGMVPVQSNFRLLGKFGLYAWEADARDITGGFPFAGSQTGSDMFFGVGVEFDITPSLGLRIEWESFDVVDSDATLASIGLLGQF